MNLENDIYKDDLNSLSFLNSINKNGKLYTIPEDYFTALPENILSNLRLNNLKNEEIFSAPQNYFSSFADKILEKVKSVETVSDEDTNTPVLNSISKENIYTVPDNYFDYLNANIFSKIDSKNSETKIIQLKSKRTSWRMAVAAAVVSAIVLSAGLIWENHGNEIRQNTVYATNLDSGSIQGDLANLSNEEITNYLNAPDGGDDDLMQQNQDAQQTKIQLNAIPSEEVENYLNGTPNQY